MVTVLDMLNRFKALDLSKEAEGIILSTKPELIEANQRRLSRGIGTDDDLLPPYTSDPYFATPAQAIAYGHYKKKIGSQAPLGIMDGKINGYMHSKIDIVIHAAKVVFFAAVPWGTDFQRKTGDRAFGISPTDLVTYRSNTFKPLLINRIKALTGAK